MSGTVDTQHTSEIRAGETLPQRGTSLAVEWIAALNDPYEYNGNRNQQEDVNQASEREGCADAEQPQDDEDDE